MPPHPAHNAHDVLAFRCRYGQYDHVHKLLDTAYVKLFGEDHRKILHDADAVNAIRQKLGYDAGTVAMHHIFMDSPTRYIDSEAMNGRLVLKRRK